MAPPSTLSSLVSHTIPNLSQKEIASTVASSQRLLDSALEPEVGPAGVGRDWSSLVDQSARTVLKQSNSNPQAALRFSQLARQFKDETVPQDKLAALTFLLSLAGSSTPGSSSAAAAPTSSASTTPAPSASTSRPSVPPPRSTSIPQPSTTLLQPTSGRKKQPLAALLASHRCRPNATLRQPVPESLLLRDILYILQGIDGEFVRFKKPSSEEKTRSGAEVDGAELAGLEEGIEFVVEGTGMMISEPTKLLLHNLSELGWLYRKIEKAILPTPSGALVTGSRGDEGKEKEREKGMIEQSLAAALKKEMTEYYRIVAVLEGQLDEAVDEGEEGGKERLTLRRLGVWTEDWRLRLRMMATLVEESGGANYGGAQLTTLHERTSNGDPFIKQFNGTLLKTLSVPFFSTLASWIYEGELRDPYGEFFVELNQDLLDEEERLVDREEGGGGTRRAWTEKFRFKTEMLPGFLEEGFGKKIFSTGKSLNFMKYSCQDAAWVVERNRAEGSNRVLQYVDMAGLERSITAAYSVASQRLFDIFFEKFRLLDHLRALKDYLMLGKGDFVEILMENLGPSLARPANNLYRHNLTATLETAIRGSTSSTDHPDTLRRLDAMMLEFTQGELGWDVFMLEYKVDAPLDTVLDAKSMESYGRMFRHLWQVKRVEYELNKVWRRLMTGARTFLRVSELSFLFHQTRLALNEMIFFIRQLQYYCHLEVIDCAWAEFEKTALKKEGDLDSLIEAHGVYLRRLIEKALFAAERRKGSKKETVPLLDQVRKIFETLLMYQEAADSLCNYALSEAGRQAGARDYARGIDDYSSPLLSRSPNPNTLPGIESRLADYSSQFKVLAVAVITSLGTHQDLDLRFLSIRLNYNTHWVGGQAGAGSAKAEAAPAGAEAS